MEKISREAISNNEKLIFPVKQSNKSRIAGKLLYWWCWLVAGSLLLFVGTPSIVALWLVDRRESLYPLAQWGARTWLRACGARVRVIGSENLDSKVPVMGQGMGFVNIIAIDRSNPERALASMTKAREVVKKGYSFGVFVEGTRALPGQLLPFKKGAFYLALQTDAPIIPVAVRNTDWMMGKRTGVAYPGEIEMVLLPPIPTEGKTVGDIPDLLLQTRRAIATELDGA
jgi:1-acyl-sn-glycerol-3-phosphate acyltransferase